MTYLNIKDEDLNDHNYYHFGKDYEEHPDCTIYIIWSRRGPGKTYSAMRYFYNKGQQIIYMKRTIEDVATICEYHGDEEFDPSPWKPLNRDFGTNVLPHLYKKGLGVFSNCDEEDKPVGKPVSYLVALSSAKVVKGMDLSEVEAIVFDEFIPQPGEIIRRAEGEMILNLYETVKRDRQKRGRPPLKLILFANADEISTPITNTLEVVDTMIEMQMRGQHTCVESRGSTGKGKIFLRHIHIDEYPLTDADLDGMAEIMEGTSWASKTYGGEFQADLSCVCDMSIKKMKCLYHLHYRRKRDIYIYINPHTGMYYVTDSKGYYVKSFNLDKENDQKRFYIEEGIDLRNACIEDRVRFKKYSYYDLLINFKKFYDV